jgi:hypothetical protein
MSYQKVYWTGKRWVHYDPMVAFILELRLIRMLDCYAGEVWT